ncbi:MAG: peptide chain release factor N(5)-glutamine methyltransferase [Armatimonadota bacterium]
MNSKKKDIRELLQFALEKLSFAGIDAPLFEARILLCTVSGLSQTDLIAHPKDILNDEVSARYIDWIERRASHIPLAYIIGEKEFYGFPFHVTPDVLIPRPETELLVEYAINFLKDRNKPVAVDLGTGSGVIAVSILRHVPDCFMYAVDISDDALRITARNVDKAGVGDRIQLLHGDMLEPMFEMECDIIVSNPPYIPSGVISSLEPEVRVHEPVSALDGGSDGLDFYRMIIKSAPRYLKLHGSLAVEIGINQSEIVAELFEEYGFYDITARKDYAGIDRIISGINPNENRR